MQKQYIILSIALAALSLLLLFQWQSKEKEIKELRAVIMQQYILILEQSKKPLSLDRVIMKDTTIILSPSVKADTFYVVYDSSK